MCVIEGEEITSFQQIQEKFGLSSTKFINQIQRNKKQFLTKMKFHAKLIELLLIWKIFMI